MLYNNTIYAVIACYDLEQQDDTLSGPPASYAPIYAQLNSFITIQLHGIAFVIQLVLLSHPCPPPSTPAALSRSYRRLRRLLRVTAAASAPVCAGGSP